MLAAGFAGHVLPTTGYFSAVPGDLGDARFNSVILEHLFRLATFRDVDLWEPGFFYPFKGVLAFSDNHFGSALPYLVLRFAGLDREHAFSGWFAIGYLLDYIAAYHALRKLGLTGFGAAVGAFAFAFSLPAIAQDGHAQLVYRYAIPMAFLAFWQYWSTGHSMYFVRSVFWGSMQFLCSIYLGVFLIYLLIASLPAFLIAGLGCNIGSRAACEVDEKRLFRYGTLFFTLGVSFGAFFMLYKYYSVSNAYGFHRPVDEIVSMLPRISSYVLADRAMLGGWLGQFVHDVPLRHEHQMFFGFGIWGLLLAGLVSGSNPSSEYRLLTKTSAMLLLFLFLGTIYVMGWSPYLLVAHLPGISSIRSVTRIVLVMLLPAGILAGIGTDFLIQAVSRKNRVATGPVVALLIFIVSFETVSFSPFSTPAAAWKKRQNLMLSMIKNPLFSNCIISLQPCDHASQTIRELDAMIFAQDHGVKTINGYSGNWPPGYVEPSVSLSSHDLLQGYESFSGCDKRQIDELASRLFTISSFNGKTVFVEPQTSRIDFGKAGNGTPCLIEGWSDPEDWGVWSVARSSRIMMHIPERASADSGKPIVITLRFQSFDGSSQRPVVQRLSVRSHGKVLYSGVLEHLDGNSHELSLLLDPAMFERKDEIVLDLLHPDAASPAELGMSSDGRTLAIGFKSADLIYEGLRSKSPSGKASR